MGTATGLLGATATGAHQAPSEAETTMAEGRVFVELHSPAATNKPDQPNLPPMTAHATTPVAPSDVRLDKWLWCVRVYKTRAQATEACRGGKVTIDGQPVRPAREVRTGQVVAINLGGWTRTLRIGALLDHRVAHAELGPYVEDITPAEERERGRERQVQNLLARPHGEGRPTKRERRALDKVFGESFE